MAPSMQERAFAAEVERCRAVAGVTQQWVADRIGLSRPKVSEVCKGDFLPTRQVLEDLIVAVGMDRVRTVELWAQAAHARQDRRRAERAAALPTPEGWTALTALPPELHDLLRAQVKAAEDLPYRLLPGARRPVLSTVYVRQELGTAIEETRSPHPQPVTDRDGVLIMPTAPEPRLSVRPPSRTLRAALDDHPNLVVTGGPGQGKSTLSLQLAADIASRWARPSDEAAPLSEPVAPLRLTARELAQRLDRPFPQALAAAITTEYGSLMRTDVPHALLAARVGGCRWLLLVDALDEVADPDQRHQLVQALSVWSDDSPYRIILTTRPIEGPVLAPLSGSAARYELQPFDDEALRLFAHHWFADEGASDRFVAQLRAARLDKLARVPLLATIAAIIYQQRGEQPLPDNQYELYEAYLEYLWAARTGRAGGFEGIRTELLEHLGRTRVETDTSLVAAARDWVAGQVPAGELGPRWQDDLLAFLTAAGPLVFRADDLWFLHHSFAEHLAATSRARELPAKFDPNAEPVTRLLHAARDDERGRLARAVLLHYSRLRPDQADALVGFLHGGTAEDHLIATRLLARHMPASPAVVDEVLRTVRGWAMTRHYHASEILKRACRILHHPGLVRWLADLMDDTDAPWRSRVTAATALATRVRGPLQEAAAELLSTVVTDSAVQTAVRLAAAEGLVECDGDHRAPADAGLRQMLADETAPATHRKEAAVILAGLGIQARHVAVDVLSYLMADDDMPVDDQVTFAAGLAEIEVALHPQCAEVFRAALRSEVRTMSGRRDAAIGMAALGSSQAAEAAAALNAVATSPHFELYDRYTAATALSELGPEHRTDAADALRRILADPRGQRTYRWQAASGLGDLGVAYQQEAAAALRRLMNDTRDINSVYWSARRLAEMGPDFYEEAAQTLLLVADDPIARFERAGALTVLAGLPGPHRQRAAEELRRRAFDPAVTVEERQHAAQSMARLNTSFHADATNLLLALTTDERHRYDAMPAARSLADLTTRFDDRVVAALLPTTSWDPHQVVEAAIYCPTRFAALRDQINDALSLIANDPALDHTVRQAAATSLLGSSRRREALIVLCDLTASGWSISSIADCMTNESERSRAQIAVALRELMAVSTSGPSLRWDACQALVMLGFGHSTDTLAQLRGILADVSADQDTQIEVALALTDLDRSHTDSSIAQVNHIAAVAGHPGTWHAAVSALAAMGVDVEQMVTEMLADADAPRASRAAAASLAVELGTSTQDDAFRELQRQATDPHLSFVDASIALGTLLDVDYERGIPTALHYYTSVVEDEDQPAEVRCAAAYQFALLDRTAWPTIVTIVRRLVVSDLQPPTQSLLRLTQLRAVEHGDLYRLILQSMQGPVAELDTIGEVAAMLDKRERDHVRRALLADRIAPLALRVEDSRLGAQSERVIRDALDGTESSLAERVDAAAALAGLGPRFAPEAASILQELAADDRIVYRALVALAGLDGPWWATVVADATAVILDPGRPMRERRSAAALVTTVNSDPEPEVIQFVRDMSRDRRCSSVDRVCGLIALRRHDGPRALRVVRDDEREGPYARMLACDALAEYTAADRATNLDVLATMAFDPATRPTMRLSLTASLSGHGKPGQERACAALQELAAPDMPVLVRAKAIFWLAYWRPRKKAWAVATLDHLVHATEGLRRCTVLSLLGQIDVIAAVTTLLTSIADGTQGSTVRLRCAETLVSLQRPYRDRAAVVARDVMRDDTVPRHIRRRAARDLANWSDALREDA